MKPINNNLFLLTVVAENLDEPTYWNLANSTFDKKKMNKFATNPSVGFDLFKYISDKPLGHEETVANTAPQGRKFWGWHCISNQGLYPSGNCIVEACIAVHCIFWICGAEHDHIISITCSP